MNIDFKVGHQIKSIRIAKHMSQSTLCEGICNINTLVKIENNSQSPSFELLLALVNRLGISMDMIIDMANYSKNTFYYTLKDNIIKSNSHFQWDKTKNQLFLIDNDIYNSLPIKEQQIIDILRIEVAKFVDKDFKFAFKLAKESLAKTYNIQNQNFFTREEIQLINILLQFDQSPKHLKTTKRALEWAENQPESFKDYYSCMLLLTGLTIYSYQNNDWHSALQYSVRGYNYAINNNGFKFIPNFLFAKGMCLYQLNTDRNRGCSDMKAALEFCSQFNMLELYEILINDIKDYNIKLERYV